jgi:DivIVA domain-containing protein
MDVTPRELRDLDIREKFRGYDPNDVDDLLERAARSIEKLESQVRDLQQRADSGAVDTAKSRENEETIQRTLILAQRAADEAVAEAQAKARQILGDAESKASTMVSEAETNARRQAETERRRLEGEVLELGSRRDALVADVDALEQFESDSRARLRRSLESDLEMLSSKGSVAPSPRPTIHNVEMPVAAASTETITTAPPAPAPPAPSPAPTPAPPAPTASVPPTPAPSVPPPAFGVAAAAPAPAPEAVEPPVAAAPAPEPAPAAEVPWEEKQATPTSRPPLFDAEPEPEHLDDDAFFASLREAVTDETPLGPREDSGGSGLFDQDDQRGGLFRRRGR